MNMPIDDDDPQIPENSDAELAGQLLEVEPEAAPIRPDVTPIQWGAIIAVLVQTARAFGVWDASPEQEDALNAASALVGALVFGDAGLRGLRNLSPR